MNVDNQNYSLEVKKYSLICQVLCTILYLKTLTQYNGKISCKCDNATIMHLKPVSDPLSRDLWDFLNRPISAFYFDLALRSFLTVR